MLCNVVLDVSQLSNIHPHNSMNTLCFHHNALTPRWAPDRWTSDTAYGGTSRDPPVALKLAIRRRYRSAQKSARKVHCQQSYHSRQEGETDKWQAEEEGRSDDGFQGSRRSFVVGATAADHVPRLWLINSRHVDLQEEGLEEGFGHARGRDRSQAKRTAGAWSRRLALALAGLVSVVPTAALAAQTTNQEVTFGTQLLKTLGIGEADIYYPSIFEGKWDCYSTLISVETPQGDDMADSRSVESAKQQLGYTVQYQARFVPLNNRVIGDRLFTTQSLVEGTIGPNNIRSGEWDPSRPNRLSLTLRGGLKVENLVTKRSFETSGPGRFDTSEFSRQVFDNPRNLDGPPSVKASGNLTRYRWDATTAEVDEIEAFQRVAMYPVVGGTAGNKAGGLSLMDVVNLSMGDKPTTIYKYIVRFKRHKETD